MADEAERTIAVEGEFAGRRVTLRVERVRLADGTETLRDVVRHPNSVVIAPVDADGNLAMALQYRNAAGPRTAGVACGASSKATHRRWTPRGASCARETGLDAEEFTEIGNFFAAPGAMTERLYAFLATGLFPNPLPADEDERITVERVPFAEAVRMARAGELNDAKTLATLLLAAPHIPGGAGA